MVTMLESTYADLTSLPMFSLSPVDSLLGTTAWSAWSSPSSITRSPSAVSSSTLSSTSAWPSRGAATIRTANLYLYRSTTPRLVLAETKKVTITLEEDPFASGGVCEAFRMWTMNADGTRGPLQVAKQYKFKDGKQGFREDHVSWFMANAPVSAFNAQLKKAMPKAPTVSFMPCVKLIELDGQWYSVEDFLEGRWTKYNNIFGTVEGAAGPGASTTFQDLAAAFSHFSFQHSGHEHLVLDVQGVEGRYTDPAIVSRTASKYGYTDTGLQGMQGFFAHHACNHLCHKLGLKPVSPLHLPPVITPMAAVTPKPCQAVSKPTTPRAIAPAASKAATDSPAAADTPGAAAASVAAAPAAAAATTDAGAVKKAKPLAVAAGAKPPRKLQVARHSSLPATIAAGSGASAVPVPVASASWNYQPSRWASSPLTTYSML